MDGRGEEEGEGGKSSSWYDDVVFVVPPDHVWLEGDNPCRSTDSRHYGPVPISSLRGRIIRRLRFSSNGDNNNNNRHDGGCRADNDAMMVDSKRPAPPL